MLQSLRNEEKDTYNSVIFSTIHYFQKEGVDTGDVYNWLDILARQKTSLSYSKDVSILEDYWVCSEFIFFFYEFIKIITNINNMFTMSYKSTSAYSLRFFAYTPERIIIEALKMIINKSGRMFKIGIKQKHGPAIEVSLERKKEFDYNKMHIYSKSINRVVNNIIPGVYIRTIQNFFNISQKPVLKFLTPADEFSCIFRISWKREALFPYLPIMAVLIITGIAALFFPMKNLNWIKYCLLSFILPAAPLLALIHHHVREMRKKRKLEKHLMQSNQDNLKRLEKLQVLSEELINKKVELENKVAARTKELQQANERLKEHDKIRSNFFDNISHELKTPLTLIASPLDSILKKQYGAALPYNKSLFTVMHNNCKRLIRLINMLLDYSKLEQGKMKLNRIPVDIISFTREQFRLFTHHVKEKNIKTCFNCTISKKIVLSIDTALFEMVIKTLSVLK